MVPCSTLLSDLATPDVGSFEDYKLGELDTSCEVNLGISRLSMVMIDGLFTFKPSNSGESNVGGWPFELEVDVC